MSKNNNKPSIFSKLYSKVVNYFKSDNWRDMYDVIKFVTMHGVMGMFALLTIISIIGIDFSIVDAIRHSKVWTILLFIFGSGSLYYFTIDFNSLLSKSWSNKK